MKVRKEELTKKFGIFISLITVICAMLYQYSLEDILDKYLIYVSGDFSEEDVEKRTLSFELASDLEINITELTEEIISTRVFNQKQME